VCAGVGGGGEEGGKEKYLRAGERGKEGVLRRC